MFWTYQADVSLVVLIRPMPEKKNIRPRIRYTTIILTLVLPLLAFTKLIAAAIKPAIPKIVSITPKTFFSIMLYLKFVNAKDRPPKELFLLSIF